MIKKLILVLFLLLGCAPKVDPIELNKTVELEFYYVQGCSECKAFKEDVIPYLEKTFNDNLVISQYDLDDPNTVVPYDKIVDSLENFDEEFYGTGPFIVLKDYFAILGYTSGDEEYIIKDIVSATKDKEYSDELEGLRFYFK